MNGEICRAFTFINYHIPMTEENNEVQYSTMGFFDGLMTERMEIDYKNDNLMKLWKYSLKKKTNSNGIYSHQNIFCFSDDGWNTSDDKSFWSSDINERYPLTFIVFLQLKDYCANEKGIAGQCKKFSEKAEEVIGNNGLVYSYATLDKNDFVVCFKCKDYAKSVEAVKRLHETGADVIYSYTILSVEKDVVKKIASENKEEYSYLFEQEIDSICLKGIANSCYNIRRIPLNEKYRYFYDELLKSLYEESDRKDIDHKLYDILGDDDFHIVVRKVNLGRLLKLFSNNGLLNCESSKYRFSLFSSSLILNIEVPCQPNQDAIQEEIKKMKDVTARKCSELKNRMRYLEKFKNYLLDEEDIDEKTATYYNAVVQLLHSLKAMEIAPTKQYDFLSLYDAFSMLVDILEEKLKPNNRDNNGKLEENNLIYDFIHKFSMTLHGTLRTDIRFFQIRDFNATVHYAPAKLRAFYAIWALTLSDFYYSFEKNRNKKYSFILSPGLFRGVAVRALFDRYEEEKKLMLITMPERQLYFPKRLCLVLAHETAHFVGHDVRQRAFRHEVWSKCCQRLFCVEWKWFYMNLIKNVSWMEAYKSWIISNEIFSGEVSGKISTYIKYELQEKDEYKDYSQKSMLRIRKYFRKIGVEYAQKIIGDEIRDLRQFLDSNYKNSLSDKNEQIKFKDESKRLEDAVLENMHFYFDKLVNQVLESFLGILCYLSSEMYADLMAVLTLNLKPIEYLEMIIQSEMDNKHSDTGGKNAGNLIVVRIGIVELAVQKIVKKEKRWLIDKEKEFYDEWSKDVFSTVPKRLHSRTETDIAVKTFAYIKECTDYQYNLSDYSSLYNVEKQEFEAKNLYILKDELIRDELVKYLESCSEIYFATWKEDAAFSNKKSYLSTVYKKITAGTYMTLVQEVENFLSNYEKTHK